MRASRDNHYSIVAIGFHWTIAIAVIGLVWLGAWMVGLTYYDPWYNDSLALHKAIGIALLVLVLAKFFWKFADRKPDFGAEVKPYERLGAIVMHLFLNTLIVLIPVTGYLISTSEGAGIDMFGLVVLPALFDISGQVRDVAIEIHFYLAYGGIALAAIHAGAALKHHVIDKGSTLTRMLIPRSRSQPGDRSAR